MACINRYSSALKAEIVYSLFQLLAGLISAVLAARILSQPESLLRVKTS
jgi:hypothetical protein